MMGQQRMANGMVPGQMGGMGGQVKMEQPLYQHHPQVMHQQAHRVR